MKFLASVLILLFALPLPVSAQHVMDVIGGVTSPGRRVIVAPRYYGYATGYYEGYDTGYYGYVRQTGIKFHMDLVPDKDRELAKKGIVSVDGNEISIVNRYDGFWNGILSLPPGLHEISIVLPDEREFTTLTSIMTGETRHIYLRFSLPVKPIEVRETRSQPIDQSEEQESRQPRFEDERTQMPDSAPEKTLPPYSEVYGGDVRRVPKNASLMDIIRILSAEE